MTVFSSCDDSVLAGGRTVGFPSDPALSAVLIPIPSG